MDLFFDRLLEGIGKKKGGTGEEEERVGICVRKTKRDRFVN